MAVDHWRKGVGQALYARAETSLREAGYSQAFLNVYEENAQARQFYEKHGWRWDGSIWSIEREGVRVVQLRYRKQLAYPGEA